MPVQISFMPLQDLGRKQSPPSPAALKACSPPPAQNQAAANRNLWGLRVAISIKLMWFSHNWDCTDTDLKLPFFFTLAAKLNITFKNVQTLLGLNQNWCFPLFPHMQAYLSSKCFSIYCEQTFSLWQKKGGGSSLLCLAELNWNRKIRGFQKI